MHCGCNFFTCLEYCKAIWEGMSHMSFPNSPGHFRDDKTVSYLVGSTLQYVAEAKLTCSQKMAPDSGIKEKGREEGRAFYSLFRRGKRRKKVAFILLEEGESVGSLGFFFTPFLHSCFQFPIWKKTSL